MMGRAEQKEILERALCRALREELYRAFLTRASEGDIDNTPIISQVPSYGVLCHFALT